MVLSKTKLQQCEEKVQDLSARLLKSIDIRFHMLFNLAEWKINTFHDSRPLLRIYSMILYRVT